MKKENTKPNNTSKKSFIYKTLNKSSEKQDGF